MKNKQRKINYCQQKVKTNKSRPLSLNWLKVLPRTLLEITRNFIELLQKKKELKCGMSWSDYDESYIDRTIVTQRTVFPCEHRRGKRWHDNDHSPRS